MPNSYNIEPIYELFNSGYVAQHTDLSSSQLSSIYNNLVSAAG